MSDMITIRIGCEIDAKLHKRLVDDKYARQTTIQQIVIDLIKDHYAEDKQNNKASRET